VVTDRDRSVVAWMAVIGAASTQDIRAWVNVGGPWLRAASGLLARSLPALRQLAQRVGGAVSGYGSSRPCRNPSLAAGRLVVRARHGMIG
jgi:hypothetical protein